MFPSDWDHRSRSRELTRIEFPHGGMLSNAGVRQSLAQHITGEVLGVPIGGEAAVISPLVMNRFSYTFLVDVETPAGHRGVHVKIPKTDLRHSARGIFPLSPEDRQMAAYESGALRELAEMWCGKDYNVSWVQLVGEAPDYNAILTEHVAADDFRGVVARLDLLRRVDSGQSAGRLCELMFRLGAALGAFHQKNSRKITCCVVEVIPKLTSYCQRISGDLETVLLDQVVGCLNEIEGLQAGTLQVPHFKGIDIRNILIDEHDELILLDPGRLTLSCREAALARLLVTYRVLHWGRGLFLLGSRPLPAAETAFLEAYYAKSSPGSELLRRLYVLKELLKHWAFAITSLEYLSWPAILKAAVRRTYINRNYARLVAHEVTQLTSHRRGNGL